MAERIVSGVERFGGLLVTFCVVGTCVCLAGFAWLNVRVSGQASEGQRARTRQQAVYPVSLKIYDDAHERGVISDGELECFKDSSKCDVRTP
jgi:hypothetical protein